MVCCQNLWFLEIEKDWDQCSRWNTYSVRGWSWLGSNFCSVTIGCFFTVSIWQAGSMLQPCCNASAWQQHPLACYAEQWIYRYLLPVVWSPLSFSHPGLISGSQDVQIDLKNCFIKYMIRWYFLSSWVKFYCQKDKDWDAQALSIFVPQMTEE